MKKLLAALLAPSVLFVLWAEHVFHEFVIRPMVPQGASVFGEWYFFPLMATYAAMLLAGIALTATSCEYLSRAYDSCP